MKRLLIVDDEHHIVNWLVELFEGQNDMDLTVMKAYTGMEALSILKVTKINIILLDINMPEINGLDLADKILSDWPGCRIIFLTGYNNFDYIYYANKHRNISYILKAEPDEVIINAVSTAIQSIDVEMHNIELQNLMFSKEKLLQYLYQKELLQDIVLGRHLKEVQDYINNYDIDFQLDIMKPVFLMYGNFSVKYSTPYSVDHNQYLLKLMKITDQILYNKFNYALLDLDCTTIMWFLQPSASFLECNDQSPVIYLKECFDEFILSIQNSFSAEIILMLYHKAITMDITGNVSHLLSQYTTYVTPKFTHSFGMIFGEEAETLIKEQNGKTSRLKQWDTDLNKLSYYLNNGQKTEFNAFLKEITRYSQDISSMNYLPLINVYLQISSGIMSYISQSNISDEITPLIDNYQLFYINDFKSWSDAFSYLERIINIIFDLSSRTNLLKNQKTINTIKDYIRNHLSEDLTLTTISDYVNYNSSYVSRIFKQTTGLSLSEYINQCRLNRAKELLMKTNESIQVIAQKVGFDTSQYFSMVFRKAVGISPRDYRNEHIQIV